MCVPPRFSKLKNGLYKSKSGFLSPNETNVVFPPYSKWNSIMDHETGFQTVPETKKKTIKEEKILTTNLNLRVRFQVKLHKSTSEISLFIWEHDNISFRRKRLQTQLGRMVECRKWYWVLDTIFDRIHQRSEQHQRVFSTHDVLCKSLQSVKCGPSLTPVGSLMLLPQPAGTKCN